MIRKIIRPMIAAVYVADGVKALSKPEDYVEGTKSVLDSARAVLPSQYKGYVPTDATMVTQAAAGTRVGAGSLLALGKAPRLAAGTLAVLSVPTIYARNAFWNTDDDQEKEQRKNGLLTNLALLGGLMVTSLDTEGKPGLAWRAKDAGRRANKSIQQALPGKSEQEEMRDNFVEGASNARDNIVEGATAAGTAAAGFFSDAGDKLADAWNDVTDYVEDNKDDWLSAAKNNAKIAKKRLVKAADKAQKRAAEAADEAQKRGEEAAKNGKKSAQKLAKKADKRANKLSNKAEKAANKAEKKLSKKLEKLS